MPYIGSQVIDGKGVALVEEWIRSMDVPDDTNLSPPLRTNSRQFKALKNLLSSKDTDTTNHVDFELLTSTTEGALALVTRMHGGDFTPNQVRALATIGSALPSSDRSGLFETFLPESMRRKRLGPNFKPEEVLRLTGDLERGRLIFFSDSSRCRNCHHPNKKEDSVGPTLSEIGSKHKTRADVLRHVIEPSKQIDETFQSYTFITRKGSIVTGLVTERTNEKVTITTAEKKLISINTLDIDDEIRSTKSLMPDQLLSDLTAQEAADLLEFIESYRKPAP